MSQEPIPAWLAKQVGHSVLNKKNTRSLIVKAQKGSLTARNKLVEHNTAYILSIAHYYSRRTKILTIEDLFQEGILGFLEGVNRFDLARKNALLTYVTWWIKLYIKRAINKLDNEIPIPRNAFSDLKKARENYEKEHGYSPTTAELSTVCPPTTPAREALNILLGVVALDRSVGFEQENATFHTFVPDLNSVSPFEHSLNNENTERLMYRLERLSLRDQAILIHRFGLLNVPPKTLKEVGEIFDLTRERVRQLQNEALRKLRNMYV